MIHESDLGFEFDPQSWGVDALNCATRTDNYAWVKDRRSIKIETQIPPDQVKRYYPGAAAWKIVCPRDSRSDCMPQRWGRIQGWDFNCTWYSKSCSTQQVETINSGSSQKLFSAIKTRMGYRSNCQAVDFQCNLSRSHIRGGCSPAGSGSNS